MYTRILNHRQHCIPRSRTNTFARPTLTFAVAFLSFALPNRLLSSSSQTKKEEEQSEEQRSTCTASPILAAYAHRTPRRLLQRRQPNVQRRPKLLLITDKLAG